MRALLEFCYTGVCLFPRDDLELGIEVLAAASQFLLEPMRLQCEQLLSSKLAAENVVLLYHAAFEYGASKLLRACCFTLLDQYERVRDDNCETLLHLLAHAAEDTVRDRDILPGLGAASRA